MSSSGAQISSPKGRDEDFFLISGSTEQRECAKELIAKKVVSQETLSANDPNLFPRCIFASCRAKWLKRFCF